MRLINRSTRRLSLTAAGQEFYDNSRRIVTEAKQAHLKLKNLQQEAVGKVALTCSVNLGLQWVVPVVNLFREQYPKIALDIHFSESISNLIDEGIDLAIRMDCLSAFIDKSDSTKGRYSPFVAHARRS